MDRYRKSSKEWGSKARKQEGRQRKAAERKSAVKEALADHGPIVDDRNYSVYCNGTRFRNLTLAQARAKAAKLVAEWTECGEGRSAEVVYRDGSTVEVVKPEMTRTPEAT